MTTVQDVIRSALQAEDLRSVDAMYQTFNEIASVFGGDFTVAEGMDIEGGEAVAVELYRNEPDSQVFQLYWNQHYSQWALMDTDEDCELYDIDEIVAQLSTLVEDS